MNVEILTTLGTSSSGFAVARRQTSRSINRQTALNLIRTHQPISRADLARKMHMQRASIGLLVTELIARGLVREEPKGPATRGRKPTQLYLDLRGRCAVAVDMRTRQTSVALTDLLGHELSPIESFPTNGNPQAFVTDLARRIRRLLARHPDTGRCDGIGLAVPGMLDRWGNALVHAPGLGWRNVPLRRQLQAATGLTVRMENSAKAAALAQLWDVRGPLPAGHIVFVNITDGVGGGVAVDGGIFRGHHNIAGEFGHMPLNIDGPPCACGSHGCWETYVSDIATLSRYVGRPFQRNQQRSLELADLSVSGLATRARSGEARALSALLTTGRFLGQGLAGIVNTLDPVRIYLTGEIIDAWDLIESTVRTAFGERVVAAVKPATEIVAVGQVQYPRLKGAAALIGVAAFAEKA